MSVAGVEEENTAIIFVNQVTNEWTNQMVTKEISFCNLKNNCRQNTVGKQSNIVSMSCSPYVDTENVISAVWKCLVSPPFMVSLTIF